MARLLPHVSLRGREIQWTVLVTLLLLVAIAYQLADLSWRLVPGSPSRQQGMPAPMPEQVTSPVMARAQQAISQWHVFGQATPPAMPPGGAVGSVDTHQLPDTSLQWVLRGIISGKDPRTGGAIIAVATADEKFHATGSIVAGVATLKEVYADHVVLERGSRLEVLRLQKALLTQGSGPGGASAMPGAGTSVTAAPRSASVGRPGRTLREYRDDVLNNPQGLNNLLQPEPVMQEGRLKGYRLQPGPDSTLFERYGLQPGDIVTSINGIALDSPAKGVAILRSVSDGGGDRVEVQMIRQGVPQTLSFSLND
ncbi:MAG: hypothetical protein HY940_03115 [Gammaproteobacteria bacterium]|nr:hypothetical protein [Gammaproteobacteria bacterium]